MEQNVLQTELNHFFLNLSTQTSPDLLKTDQFGENLRLIYDLLHYTEENDIPGILLLIDFEKTCDSLSWSYINKTRRTFRFGPSVIRWCNIFYQDAKSTESQCGYLSGFFQMLLRYHRDKHSHQLSRVLDRKCGFWSLHKVFLRFDLVT